MGLFFKEENKTTGSFLEDQNSVFSTKGEAENAAVADNYDEYVYKPKTYDDVPKYRAKGTQNIQLVVDNENFGYEDLNANLNTISLQKNNLHEDLNEIVSNAPIIDEAERGKENKSIYETDIGNQEVPDEEIEIIDIDEGPSSVNLSELSQDNFSKGGKLSIFGVHDEPIQAKVYEIKDIKMPEPEPPKFVQPEEKPLSIDENGNKHCPKCGAPLAPNAQGCFLCGYKFE